VSIDLQRMAHRMRLETFKTIARAGGGHFGGCLSETEILTALYFSELRVDPQNPKWEDRDRLVLSKGHGGPGLYIILAERGFFPKEWLAGLDQSGGRLPKHVDLMVPGVDVSAGSLGQGLSIGIGMALASRLDASDRRIYVVLGDGECDEGQVWEAATAASKYCLDNLTAIVDRNKVQVDGCCAEIMPTEPFALKWEAFGWNAVPVDGHSVDGILEGLEIARETRGKPTVIIADTIKGKGVSFMENQAKWHSGSVTAEQFEIGVSELERELVK